MPKISQWRTVVALWLHVLQRKWRVCEVDVCRPPSTRFLLLQRDRVLHVASGCETNFSVPHHTYAQPQRLTAISQDPFLPAVTMHASAATSPGSSLLPALLVVLCLLYPPSGCACFRLGKHGGNASTITSTSGGAGSSPSSSPAKWKTPQWGKMFAEALGQTGNTNDGSHTSMECNAADELMRKRGPDNYRKALEEYKALLEKEPDKCV